MWQSEQTRLPGLLLGSASHFCSLVTKWMMFTLHCTELALRGKCRTKYATVSFPQHIHCRPCSLYRLVLFTQFACGDPFASYSVLESSLFCEYESLGLLKEMRLNRARTLARTLSKQWCIAHMHFK